MTPQLTIVIPTRDRPALLCEAVDSALAQTAGDFEVVVVDDASDEPPALTPDPRLRVLRLPARQGGAAARNAGTHAAAGRWITYLDDDDRLLPEAASVSLEACAGATLPPPVGVLSGVQVLAADGRVVETRLPPTLPRGAHFALEQPQPGTSFHTKQTLVVQRDVVLAVGGWDPAFRSRVHTELFLRLNPACSLLGIPDVTYQLRAHAGARVSGDPRARLESFDRLRRKHRAAFAAHPERYADLLWEHARSCGRAGRPDAALLAGLRAVRVAPAHIARRVTGAGR